MGIFVDLATRILEQCKALEETTSAQCLAQWNDFPEIELTMPAKIAKSAAQLALQELSEAIKMPTETITSLGMRTVGTMPFQALYRFRIADNVPTEHCATYKVVAEACGMAEQDLRRIVRYLITWNIFAEVEPDHIAHTGPSRAFKENKLLQQCIGMCTEELAPSTTYHVDAMAKWPGSGELNQCGSRIAHSTKINFFHAISESPTRSKRFADAMTFMGRMPGLGIEPLLNVFDWDALGEATVVDVGGSHGETAKKLRLKYPKLSFVVQDLPTTIEGIRHLPNQDRLSFVAYNFFEEQLTRGDVYMFRWIFHDWPDESCIKILQNLRPALKEGSRVLIMDMCLSEPGQAPRMKEQVERSFDLTMWSMNNAKERSKEEWMVLIKQADARFSLDNVISTPGCLLCILEVRWTSHVEGDYADE